jgi:spore maturation protein CgeB
MNDRMRIVFLGLSVTSSWGNGHATTYRALMKGLARRGHDVLFLERDVPWYAEHRDQRFPPHGRTVLYRDLEDLRARATRDVRDADLVVLGSYVPDGVAVGEWVVRTARGVKAFYDIDTPVTIAKLERGDEEYLSRRLVPRFDLYLSFTGGPVLQRLERTFHAERAVPLYCSVDPDQYRPLGEPDSWDLGYLGTYAEERQATLGHMLIEPARRWPHGRFVVAGAQYPRSITWPRNVERRDHVPPTDHPAFYSRQRYALNVTRPEMVETGYAPSVRLFEAAACATPVISDWWQGLDTFFRPGAEILVAGGPIDVLALLRDVPEEDRRAIGDAARRRVLAEHTSERRAQELEEYVRPAAVEDTGASAAAAS